MEFLYRTFGWWNYSQRSDDPGILPWKDSVFSRPRMKGAAVESDGLEEDYALVPEMSEEEKKKYTAHGKTWDELVEVFQDAPADMQDIVDHLIKPCDPEWRAAFVVGPPGTGKSTATLAIPHLARWYWMFLSGPALAGQYRNEAKERLTAELVKAVNSRRKTVVIVDELNKLLENFNSKDHDTDTTGSFFWTFLDAQKRNQNFFFIGTMNRDDKVPDPVKHRFGGSTIYFPAIEDPEKLLIIFKKVMARNIEMAFDSECDDAFLESCFKSLESEGIALTPRDYENIRFQIARLTRRDDKLSAVRRIKQYHLTNAIHEVATTYTRSGLGREQLSEEEWRDFNAIQGRIFEVKIQCCHKIQASASLGVPFGINIARPAGLDLDQAIEVIEEEFTPAQIALYRRIKRINDRDSLISRGWVDSIKQGVRSGIAANMNLTDK